MGYDFDLICIGSGPSGQRGAVQAAKLGKKVAIVEKQMHVGGVSLHTGTIPSKTFREAVLSYTFRNQFSASHNYRLSPNTGIQEVTADAIEPFKHVNKIIEREASVQKDQLVRNGIEIITGKARFLDPHSLLIETTVEPRKVTAENILISVGTEPFPAPKIPVDGEFILTSDDLLHLEHVPKEVIVIGCGVIGVEYASMLAKLGISVTIVDGRARPLEFLDDQIIDELVGQMRSNNVYFRLGETVDTLKIEKGKTPRVLILLQSGKQIEGDVALVCAGRIGATKNLNLTAAGLKTDARGRLEVDNYFRCAVPHIFAAGDVIGYPSLAATSSEQGRLAACAAFGVDAKPMAKHFPVGVYSIPEVSMVGMTEQDLKIKNVPYEIGVARYREIARGQILDDETGFLKMIFHRDNYRLLGVHALGTGATELIHIGQCALALGGGLEYFLETVFNYPTLAECYKVAALDAHNKLNS